MNPTLSKLAGSAAAYGCCGETGIETNHTPCQDEKVGHLAAYPSGRNRHNRRSTGEYLDLKASRPFHVESHAEVAAGDPNNPNNGRTAIRLRFLKVNNPSSGRDRDSLRATAGTELLHDVLHMRLHGLFRNEEMIGDIPISISCGGQLQHFNFTFG